jgi:PKD repeat protein
MRAFVKREDYKKILASVILLAVLGLNIAVMPVQSYLIPAVDREETYSTGLNDPTSTQMDWMKKNVPVVKDVNMNILALERLNQERTSKGLPVLSEVDTGAVLAGNELVYSDSSEPLGGDALPGSVDNSKTVYFPPIRSQGSLGSCVAWATTYYAFTYETNFARGRTASTGDNNMIFSPKWTYNMINYGANSGAYFSDAFYLLTKHGAVTWAEFPYDSNYLQWCLDASAWRDAINYRAASWSQIYNTDTASLIVQLKTQLANGHVMVIGTYVSSWISTYIKDDPATTEEDALVNQRIATYVKNTRQGGHGMTLVGYNDNIWCDLNGDGNVDDGEKGAFKIANSWGTGDWNSGYRWVTYDSLWGTSQVHSYGTWPTADRDSRGIFRGGDIYTLTVRAGYTPKVVAEFTINHLKRGQLYMSLGIGDVTAVTPSYSWAAEAIYGSGGSYAFDGTTMAKDGTFVFDFTGIIPTSTEVKRWFVGMKDSTTGDVATITAFKLYQVTAGGDVLVASSSSVPKTADGSQSYVWVDYQYNSLNSSPTASVVAAPTSGVAPLMVLFDGSASSDPDGTIVSYGWSFGDSSSGTGKTISHTYSNSGTYTATLTVTDDDGAKSSRSVSITVTAVLPNKAPTAVVKSNITSGDAPLGVAFDGTGSSDTDGTITNYQWSFGDGQTGSGAAVVHSYAGVGTYTATLTVTDDDGAMSTSSIVITVSVKTSYIINAPTNLVASSPPRTVVLTWIDNSNNEDGFIIQIATRSRGQTSVFINLTTVGENVTTYTYSVSSGMYTYRIYAFDTAGKTSGYSNQVMVRVR